MWLLRYVTLVLLYVQVRGYYIRQTNRPYCEPGATGVFPHPWDCRKFLNCYHGRTFIQDCGPGTVLNPTDRVCDWPYNVDCSGYTTYKPRIIQSTTTKRTTTRKPTPKYTTTPKSTTKYTTTPKSTTKYTTTPKYTTKYTTTPSTTTTMKWVDPELMPPVDYQDYGDGEKAQNQLSKFTWPTDSHFYYDTYGNPTELKPKPSQIQFKEDNKSVDWRVSKDMLEEGQIATKKEISGVVETINRGELLPEATLKQPECLSLKPEEDSLKSKEISSRSFLGETNGEEFDYEGEENISQVQTTVTSANVHPSTPRSELKDREDEEFGEGGQVEYSGSYAQHSHKKPSSQTEGPTRIDLLSEHHTTDSVLDIYKETNEDVGRRQKKEDREGKMIETIPKTNDLITKSWKPKEKLWESKAPGVFEGKRQEKMKESPPSGQTMRLRSNSSYLEGFLEVKGPEGYWGLVCDKGEDWSMLEASAICKMLGFTRGAQASWQGFSDADRTEELDAVVLSLNCSEEAQKLTDCDLKYASMFNECEIGKYAVGLKCIDNFVSQCQPGEVHHNGNCYGLTRGGLSLGESEEQCRSQGGHLLDILTQNENDFISQWLIHIFPHLTAVGTGGVGVSVFGNPLWIWEGSDSLMNFQNWWRGWMAEEPIPHGHINNPLCILLSRRFPCQEGGENVTCLTDYFFWEAVECSQVKNIGFSFVCKRPEDDVGCVTSNSLAYDGKANTTEFGLPCSSWDTPEIKAILSAHLPEADRVARLSGHNYCRAVQASDDRPLCVDVQGSLHNCDIPSCLQSN